MRCQPYAVFSIATRQTGGKLPKAVERGGEKERVRGREREREREGDSLRVKERCTKARETETAIERRAK